MAVVRTRQRERGSSCIRFHGFYRARDGRADNRCTIGFGAAVFCQRQHQGVKFRGVGDPVLYLNDPPGIDRSLRRRILDDIASINQRSSRSVGDPEIATRIAQYELAYRMQTSVPELTDVNDEPESVFDMLWPGIKEEGNVRIATVFFARRLAERGVRFIQLFHMGWDQHKTLAETDQGAVLRHRSAHGGINP